MGLTQVSKDGVKNDAIDASKLPANSVGASELADNAVDTNAIADQAVALSKLPHGDGSSDGKFLRANNGADPTFETVTGTTINNNADNRVITGSGTANTLNGESSVVIDANGKLGIGRSDPQTTFHSTGTTNGQQATFGASSTGLKISTFAKTDNDAGVTLDAQQSSNGTLTFATTGTERMRIDSSGKVGIGITNPLTALHVQQDWVNNVGSIGVEGSSNALCGYGFRSNGTYKAALIYRDGSSGNYLDLGTYNGNYPILFRPNATEKVRIDNEGLKFNGDTATANALNDYETGSFVPYINSGFTVTYGSQDGNYTKIGNLVHFRLYIKINSISGSSDNTDARIRGLPFGSANESLGFGVTVPWIYGLGQNVQQAYVQGNQNYIELLNNPTGGDREHTNANSCWDQNDLRISIAGVYRTP